MLKTVSDLVMEVSANVRSLPAEQALEELKAGGGCLIDVREPAEAESRSVSMAMNVPRGILEMTLPKHYPDPDAPIYLHCATGGRARLSSDQLQRLGYRRVTAISCSLDDVCRIFDNE